MKQYVYADNAATTQVDRIAVDAMTPYLLEEYGNASQSYAFSRVPKKALQEAREIIAACIGASSDEVFFTSGGTESDNWAIKGIAMPDEGTHTIITSSFEHHAVLHSCAAMERQGHRVVYLKPERTGEISPDVLRKEITGDTKLVSVMYANNEIGSIQPIKDLSDIAHEKGALFHTDAVQAVGHEDIDVHSLGIDMLSASAHKFNGMKGCGFLYVRKGCRLIPYADGGAQESGSRAGTENIPGIVAMAAALKNNCDHLEENRKNIAGLENEFLRLLKETDIPFVRNGGLHTLPGLISLSFPRVDGEAILHRMDLLGICISTGSACNSKDTEISHVLKAIDLDEEYAKGTIRVSLGKYNTSDDVKKIVRGLKKIVSV
ncbi:MAG: cysteine desulfurase [Ruminococcus flavefaciens]|nr:cysteine desulfurase [Ruminococcus flavefaciens]